MKLTDYIRGQRHGKDAHQIEREAMHDPFLSDAIDGFDSVDGNHAEKIEELRRLMSKKTNRRSNKFIYSGIAACLLICLTVGFYFMFNNKDEKFIAKNEPVENEYDKSVIQEEPPQTPQPLAEDESSDISNKQIELMEEAEVAPNYEKEQKQSSSSRSAPVRNKAIVKARDKEMEVEDDYIVAAKRQINTDTLKEQIIAKIAIAETDKKLNNSEVHGKVIDAYGEPVIGANVMACNSKNDVVTDMNGEFVLPIDATDSIIKASYIGYETAEAACDTGKPVLLALKDDNQSLSEVVVAGYGVSKKTAKVEKTEPKIGWKEYKKYLKESKHRPADVECAKAKGTVEVSFLVDEDGIPYDYEIVHSVCSSADDEAIRLIKDGCLWTYRSTERVTVKVKF